MTLSAKELFMKKKMFFGMLAGVLTFGLVLTGCEKANPETDFERGLNRRGGVIITGYVGQSWDVVIPSRLDGKPVTDIGRSAFRNHTHLMSVSIPASVTVIEGWAFLGCTGLMSVSIPEGVTEIGAQAFWVCSSLTSVTIPASVTKIGDRAFGGCTGLTAETRNAIRARFGDGVGL
jgi:hypothetical protein